MPQHHTSKPRFGERFGNPIKDAQIEDRLKKLEEKVFKLGKSPTTRSQQMLLLKHLGLLDIILKLDISNKKKSILLSSILNSSQDNIEGDLSIINSKTSKLRTTENYAFLIKAFDETGLKELSLEMEKEFNLISNQQNKLNSKK